MLTGNWVTGLTAISSMAFLFLSIISWSIGPGKPFIIAEAFKWHLPCKTIPLTWNHNTINKSLCKWINTMIRRTNFQNFITDFDLFPRCNTLRIDASYKTCHFVSITMSGQWYANTIVGTTFNCSTVNLSKCSIAFFDFIYFEIIRKKREKRGKKI